MGSVDEDRDIMHAWYVIPGTYEGSTSVYAW